MADFDFDFDALDDMVDDLPTSYQAKPEPPEVKKTLLPEPTKPLLADKDIKILETAVKEAQKLTKSLETLDFQIEKFNKFENTVSSFKLKNTLIAASVGIFMGAYAGSYAQSELNDYWLSTELASAVKDANAAKSFMSAAEHLGVVFSQDAEHIVIYTTVNNKAASVWQNKQYMALQIQKKDKK